MSENLVYYKINTEMIETLFGVDFKNGGLKTISCSNYEICRKYGFVNSDKCTRFCPVIEKAVNSIFGHETIQSEFL